MQTQQPTALRSMAGVIPGANLSIILSIASVLAILATPFASTLHYLIPAIAVLAGIVLLNQSFERYIVFSLWCWLLIPLLRRIVDYRSFYLDPSPILLTPLLVAGLVVFRLPFLCHRLLRSSALPYLLLSATLGYGLAVGLLLRQPTDVARTFLLWGVPLAWGLYLTATGGDGSEARELVIRHMTWAVLLLGIYGLIQYVAPPAWDLVWLKNAIETRDVLAFGLPEARQVRVWSSTNGPGVFAITCAFGLTLLLAKASRLSIPAGIAGSIGLLLSLVRISWLAFAAGIVLTCLWSGKRRFQMIVGISVIAAILGSVLSLPVFEESVVTRLQTLGDVKNDTSIGDRRDTQAHMIGSISNHPFGFGLSTELPETVTGGMAIDSGIFEVILLFGWAGATVIFVVLSAIAYRSFIGLFQATPSQLGFRVAILVILIHMPSGSVLSGPQGFLFWTAVSLSDLWPVSSRIQFENSIESSSL